MVDNTETRGDAMTETVVTTVDSTVVTLNDIIAPVVVTESSVVTIEAGTPTVILAGAMGPPGASSLNSLSDVDTAQLQDGGVLVYKVDTQRWTATNTLERQILEGGQF